MNVIWSKYVQGINTLYYSRKLRFDDMFAPRFKELFCIDESKKLKILEIGCGPGALASALARWYPNAEITALDRDTDFIRFAKEHENRVNFIEGDATSLPFEDEYFDVTISNTVSEHIEPSKFFGEQMRVLKHGGTCLLLSSRKSISSHSRIEDEETAFEKAFWEKAREHDNIFEKYGICRYQMSESQLPATMENYGFVNVNVGYALIDLTPDAPKYSRSMAQDMINCQKMSDLDSIDSVLASLPELYTNEDGERMKALVREKYNKRLSDLCNGKKHWDTELSIIMTLCGIKS